MKTMTLTPTMTLMLTLLRTSGVPAKVIAKARPGGTIAGIEKP